MIVIDQVLGTVDKNPRALALLALVLFVIMVVLSIQLDNCRRARYEK